MNSCLSLLKVAFASGIRINGTEVEESFVSWEATISDEPL